MNNADKVYLLMELLGYNVVKQKDEKVEKLISSKSYQDLDKVLWLVRSQKDEDREIADTYLNLKIRCDSYFDAMVLDAEIAKLNEKSAALNSINPYIFNQYRKLDFKELGQVKIPYRKTLIGINEYILGSDVAKEQQIEFLNKQADIWYNVAQQDILEGIEKNKENFEKVQKMSKFRYPLWSILTIILNIVLVVALGIVLFNDSNEKIVNFRVGIDLKNIYSILMLVTLCLLAAVTFMVNIFRAKNKNYRHSLVMETTKANGKYNSLLGKLALKNETVIKEIDKAVTNKSELKLNYREIGVINNSSYGFDSSVRNFKIDTKKQYVSKHKGQVLLTLIGLFSVTVLTTLVTLITLGVFKI